jgi:DNA-binding transcriptional LysR family regulator
MRASWDDLQVFLAVARAGTLGAAGRALKQTQPTVGRRIRALETALGQSLFQRTTGGFILTNEGAAVLVHAERMEEEAIAFERGVAGQSDVLGGLLRISTSDWFAVHCLSPLLAEFSKRHSGIQIEVLTDTRLMSLSRREADLLFRFGKFEEPDVIQRVAVHLDYALYGGRSYLKGRETLRNGDGEGHRLIAMDQAFDSYPDVAWLKRVLPSAKVTLRSNNRDVQLGFCTSGAGLAVLPCVVGDAVSDLVRVELGEAPPGRDVRAGFHRDLKRLPRLRALLEFLYAQPPFVHAANGASASEGAAAQPAKRSSTPLRGKGRRGQAAAPATKSRGGRR